MAQHAQRELATSSPPAPFPRILCAVDGSRFADEAAAQALTLAGPDAQVTFLTVAGTGIDAQARIALKNARAVAAAAGIEASELVRHKDDHIAAILDEARGHDLLVLGIHGRHRGGGFLLGGTAVAALHRSPVPVLVARRTRVGTEFPRDILLATDGSPAMRPAVAITAALVGRHDARVVLLHVGQSDRDARRELAEESAALIEATGFQPVTLQLDGHTPSRIAEIALELPASLVVTGSRMLSGIRSLGSVSERTGLVAPCSVLVLRRAA